MDKNQPDLFDRIMSLPGLRIFNRFYVKHKDVLLYIFFGGLTTVVSVGSFALANSLLHLDALIANVISWLCAVSFAYITNRTWVFHSKVRGRAVITEALSFYAGRLTTFGIEEALLFLFVTRMGLNSIYVKIVAQFVVLVLNYLISKIVVFRKKKKSTPGE